MADRETVRAEPDLGPDAGAAARGTLTVADRVCEKIAARAALDVDSVTAFSGGGVAAIGRLVRGGHGTGDDLPWAQVDRGETRTAVAVGVALVWPCEVARVAREIRSHVGSELFRLTGIRPDRVDVTVDRIVPSDKTRTRREGRIVLSEPTEVGT